MVPDGLEIDEIVKAPDHRGSRREQIEQRVLRQADLDQYGDGDRQGDDFQPDSSGGVRSAHALVHIHAEGGEKRGCQRQQKPYGGSHSGKALFLQEGMPESAAGFAQGIDCAGHGPLAAAVITFGNDFSFQGVHEDY